MLSAPAWMKENGEYRCPQDPSCTGCVLKKTLQAVWAEYISRFIDAYSDVSDVWAITVQNEPLNCPNNYEGMHFSAESERDFIRDHLGPLLRAKHPKTLLLAYDHNKDKLEEWADVVLGDKVGDSLSPRACLWRLWTSLEHNEP